MTPPIVFQVQSSVTLYEITVIYLFFFVPLQGVKQSASHTVILPYISKRILLKVLYYLRYFEETALRDTKLLILVIKTKHLFSKSSLQWNNRFETLYYHVGMFLLKI